MQFMQLLVVVAMPSCLAALVTLWYPLTKGCKWGYCDSIRQLGYKGTLFAVSSL